MKIVRVKEDIFPREAMTELGALQMTEAAGAVIGDAAADIEHVTIAPWVRGSWGGSRGAGSGAVSHLAFQERSQRRVERRFEPVNGSILQVP